MAWLDSENTKYHFSGVLGCYYDQYTLRILDCLDKLVLIAVRAGEAKDPMSFGNRPQMLKRIEGRIEVFIELLVGTPSVRFSSSADTISSVVQKRRWI